MKIVVISSERIFPGEGEILNMLFSEGLEVLHLRKPGTEENELRQLISETDPQYRNRIVLHDYFNLVGEFGLKGIHLNKRNPRPPEGYNGHISCSCHSLSELVCTKGQYDYVFLSPVFDSISKRGYGSAFDRAELIDAHKNGIINDKVYALGGVNVDNIPDAARMGFGGVAILGALWQDFLKNSDKNLLSDRWNRLLTAVRETCKGCCS